ncbi:trimeric intracellular cation channel family protein [Pokkaliibacter plantistimulans]|uniref:trimeric intracellular cation channel family protein n=1 Tax=Pokkaliibacter plantistimulans TaxID=1635171 RepID=UPI001A9C53A5|nr:trimeric intracellular cation channel family protein [Pokkaliibacter plantistimulans]
MSAEVILQSLDYFGIVVFAMAGALRGEEKSLDLFGVLVFSIVTATGGGTLRDLLMGNLPVNWVKDNAYIWLALAGGTFTFMFTRFWRFPVGALAVADAIGLAVFTVLGADQAAHMGFSPLIVIVTAVMTGCVGGVIRDLLANEIPLIFHREIYATAAIVGAVVYLVLQAWGLDERVFPWLAMLVVLMLRLAALRWDLRLPRFMRTLPRA